MERPGHAARRSPGMGAPRPRRALRAQLPAVLVLAFALPLAHPGVAAALFGGRVDITVNTFTTDRLGAPTNLVATSGTSVSLTWNPTDDGYAAGYEILRSAAPSGPFTVVGTATPATLTSFTDPTAGTWHYAVRTIALSWQSEPSNTATATAGTSVTTSWAGCTANAADTGGDGNGYQTTPAGACGDGGTVAVDPRSGTNTVSSCTDPGKDRHRFRGYGFAPPPASVIAGIEVRLDAFVSNNSGTNTLCVQLSWDGGTSWTTPRQTTVLSNTEATFVLGGPADTWGRTWTPAELGDSAFRLRVVNVTTGNPNTDVSLDFAAVRITHRS